VLASQQLAPGGIALDAKNAYFSNVAAPGSVVAVPLGGGTATTLATGLGTPDTIAIDATHAYTADQTGNSIMVTMLDGSGFMQLVNMQMAPTGLALDAQDRNVYWTNAMGGTVTTAKLASGTESTLAAGLTSPYAIALDATSVYWSDVADGTIVKLPLSGGAPVTLAKGLMNPSAIVVDAKSVYWVDGKAGVVAKVAIAGGAVTTLASGQKGPDALALDASSVYWTNAGDAIDGSVMRVPIAGGKPVTLADGLDSPGVYGGIALDATSVYWSLDPAGGMGTGAVMKLTPR
jgi:sugar lactone lactonase YvrE